MVFLLIKFFAEITYQWITVTHLIIATSPFSSFVVPDPGMGVSWDCRHQQDECLIWNHKLVVLMNRFA
jgi:hypothetical protein